MDTRAPTGGPDGVHAAPPIPTPLVELVLDDGSDVSAGEGELRWRRLPPGETTPTAATPRDAPTGWRATAGDVVPLAPTDGDGRWLAGVGRGDTPADWRALGAAAVRAARAALAAGETDDGTSGDPAGPLSLFVRPDTEADAPGDADDPDEEGAPGDDATGAADAWAALATGVVLGSHRLSLRSRPRADVGRVRLPVPPRHRDAVARAVVLARATALARDLADTPAGLKSPAWFADRAVAALGPVAGLEVTVHDEQWLAENRFGGVLAVGGGSARPPRLLEISWAPADAAGDHVVLVGKGITFDTGGISIKPTASMVDMRTDCSGGAAVVATMRALGELGVPRRVTGLVPLAENHVSGSAYRPGDVVRHRDGTTSEVTNTDAEGRMVLADALGHAVELLAPDLVVDVATLTGAAKSALGVRTGAVFATSPELARRILDAGGRVGESWWPLPLAAAHEEAVSSTIADVRQAPTGPGAITAALFLRRFTGGLPWAHLDIAGPARCDAAHEEVARGATGFAARTLVELCAADRPGA